MTAAKLRAQLQDLEGELDDCDDRGRRRELWWEWLRTRGDLELAERAEDRELIRAARGVAAVERAVQHGHALLAVDALGHFLRGGAPGPPLFEIPERARRAA